MELEIIERDFTICRVKELEKGYPEKEFCFTGRTDEELSLVCAAEDVPAETIERDDGWKAFRIKGVLDLSLTGILAPIASLLAENGIGMFAVSTFNTDYVLIKKENFDAALDLLAKAGYRISKH